ncbi:MAG: GDP-L-fucose synthase [Desulfobacterales bacterium]|jgi:GDP-L-fucose synthase
MNKDTRIFIAGHRGMVGSAIHRHLLGEGFEQILTRSRERLDLTDQAAVSRFFAEHPLDYVVLAAARVGGIHANNAFPADFIYQNLIIQTNVIHAAWRAGIRRLLFLGSSCIYPKNAPQPMPEETLLGGSLEPTNEPYAIAKIAGIKMCESYNRQYATHYRSVMPTNLYGPHDNYDLETSHVLPAFIRKFHLAKLVQQGDWEAIARDERCYGKIPQDLRRVLGIPEAAAAAPPAAGTAPRLVLWGSGAPYREFLHVDDLAAACYFIMQQSDEALAEVCRISSSAAEGDLVSNLRPETCLLNIGTGDDIRIRDLAALLGEIVGFRGEILWDTSRPDGTPRKRLDVSRLSRLGWRAAISLRAGIEATYRAYLAQMGM